MARPDVLDVLTDRPSLAAAVWSVADLLAHHGVRPGDRVVVSLPNSVTSVQAYLGCAAVGAIWAGVNPSAPVKVKARQCEMVAPRVVIGAGDGYAPDGVNLIAVGPDGLAPVGSGSRPPRPDLDAPCAIAFSSGTTGDPKAIVHSRAGVSLAAAALATTTLRPDDRVGVTLPCSIHNVMIVGPLTCLMAGATTVLLDGFTAREVAAKCREERLTMVRALVPATVYDMVHDDAIVPDSLASLREAGTGAAGLAETLRAAFEAKFGIRLSGSYGLSEAPAAVCSEDTGMPRRPGSSGMPLPHASITIRDPAGMCLPSGELGEIWVGPASDGPLAGQYRGALGRWVDGGLVPSAGGEFATGDVGSLDDRGSLHVVGRTGDVITRGGVTVAAAEIEDVMGDFEGVRAAAVIGRPDDRLGERIVAFVEPETGRHSRPGRRAPTRRDRAQSWQGARRGDRPRGTATQCDGQGRTGRTAAGRSARVTFSPIVVSDGAFDAYRGWR